MNSYSRITSVLVTNLRCRMAVWQELLRLGTFGTLLTRLLLERKRRLIGPFRLEVG